jgi:flagellar biosynthesis protein FliQ
VTVQNRRARSRSPLERTALSLFALYVLAGITLVVLATENLYLPIAIIVIAMFVVGVGGFLVVKFHRHPGTQEDMETAVMVGALIYGLLAAVACCMADFTLSWLPLVVVVFCLVMFILFFWLSGISNVAHALAKNFLGGAYAAGLGAALAMACIGFGHTVALWVGGVFVLLYLAFLAPVVNTIIHLYFTSSEER